MQDDTRNWGSASLGIIAISTTLAVATGAGIFAAKEFESGLPTLTTVLATLLAATSLLLYLAVVLFGLFALLENSQATQRKRVVIVAYSVVVQAYTAVLAAGMVILFPFWNHIWKEFRGSRFSKTYSWLPSTTRATPPTVMKVPNTSQRLTFSCTDRNSDARISVNSGLADTMGATTTTSACCRAK